MSAALRNYVTKSVDRSYSLTGIARNIPVMRLVTTRGLRKRAERQTLMANFQNGTIVYRDRRRCR